MIEPNASEPHRRFLFTPWVRDNHDGTLATENSAGPGRKLTAEPDVDTAGQVRGGEYLRISRVERLTAHFLNRENLVERHRVQFAGKRLVEGRVFLTVQHRIIGEVGRRVRLIGRDEIDKRRLAHRLQGVIGSALFTYGGHRLFAQGLAAQRTSAVGRVDEA